MQPYVTLCDPISLREPDMAVDQIQIRRNTPRYAQIRCNTPKYARLVCLVCVLEAVCVWAAWVGGV